MKSLPFQNAADRAYYDIIGRLEPSLHHVILPSRQVLASIYIMLKKWWPYSISLEIKLYNSYCAATLYILKYNIKASDYLLIKFVFKMLIFFDDIKNIVIITRNSAFYHLSKINY